ncbi:MAG: peroxiredoxin [Gammaproteobacteria bacterium]|nr:peroxiredoxin [Gammaproteobacteria bacterium]
MSTPTLNKKAPDFTIAATGEQNITLSDYIGKNIVLYFYPRDNTPGCTQEGQDFRDQYNKFKRNKTVVFGVSRDSVTSHQRFKEKQGFPFELLSDQDEVLCGLYDVIKEKNMYGKKVMGIERSTFLIDQKGILREEWRKVKVKGHIDEVLQRIREINRNGE